MDKSRLTLHLIEIVTTATLATSVTRKNEKTTSVGGDKRGVGKIKGSKKNQDGGRLENDLIENDQNRKLINVNYVKENGNTEGFLDLISRYFWVLVSLSTQFFYPEYYTHGGRQSETDQKQSGVLTKSRTVSGVSVASSQANALHTKLLPQKILDAEYASGAGLRQKYAPKKHVRENKSFYPNSFYKWRTKI